MNKAEAKSRGGVVTNCRLVSLGIMLLATPAYDHTWLWGPKNVSNCVDAGNPVGGRRPMKSGRKTLEILIPDSGDEQTQNVRNISTGSSTFLCTQNLVDLWRQLIDNLQLPRGCLELLRLKFECMPAQLAWALMADVKVERLPAVNFWLILPAALREG